MSNHSALSEELKWQISKTYKSNTKKWVNDMKEKQIEILEKRADFDKIHKIVPINGKESLIDFEYMPCTEKSEDLNIIIKQ